jgi:hypothetical protein
MVVAVAGREAVVEVVVTGEEIGVGVFSEYLKIEAGQNRG